MYLGTKRNTGSCVGGLVLWCRMFASNRGFGVIRRACPWGLHKNRLRYCPLSVKTILFLRAFFWDFTIFFLHPLVFWGIFSAKEDNDSKGHVRLMKVLAIETSCDDTGAAVVLDGRNILSNIVSSQVSIHQKYGGVVPELASRKHIESIVPIVTEALEKAKVTLREIDGIAVTQGPGLVGSLLVGLSFAKSIAFATGLPFIGVNHIEAHLSAIFLEEKPPRFPFVGLVVSGGHTSLFRMDGFGKYKRLGQTRDDE